MLSIQNIVVTATSWFLKPKILLVGQANFSDKAVLTVHFMYRYDTIFRNFRSTVLFNSCEKTEHKGDK